MKIEILSQQADNLVLKLSGQLDTLTSPEVETFIAAQLSGAPVQLTLDFAEVGFMSSAGLRVLLALQKRMRTEKGTLALINVNENVHRVFEVTGLRQAFGLV